MNLYEFYKKDMNDAESYHDKYDLFLKNIPDSLLNTKPEIWKREKNDHYINEKNICGKIHRIDIEYFVAKEYVVVNEKRNGDIEIKLSKNGRIFLTEVKGFREEAKRKVEIENLKYEEHNATRYVIKLTAIGMLSTAIFSFFSDDNLLRKVLCSYINELLK